MSNLESSESVLDAVYVPNDLVGALCLLLVSDAAILAPVLRTSPLRIPFGILLLLFLPGYVLSTVLLPSSRHRTAADNTTKTSNHSVGRFDVVGRLTFAIVLSLVVVMAIALVLDFSGVGIRFWPALLVLNGVIVLTTPIAAVRRSRVPPERRLRVPVRQWAIEFRIGIASFDRRERVLSVLLIGLVLVTASATVYSATVADGGAESTELYLLGVNETGGAVATEYLGGENDRLVAAVRNDEHQPVKYTLIVQAQQMSSRDESASVQREREWYRFTPRIEHGVTWRVRHSVVANETRHPIRIVYLLYRGSPPPEPTRENAYREVYLWTNATTGNQSQQPTPLAGT